MTNKIGVTSQAKGPKVVSEPTWHIEVRLNASLKLYDNSDVYAKVFEKHYRGDYPDQDLTHFMVEVEEKIKEVDMELTHRIVWASISRVG